jgi:nucleotide sugar dehydrogenase
MKKVAVIGLGYVGLPLLCAIAKCRKYKVFGLDIDKDRIRMIEKKVCPIDDKTCQKDLLKVKLEVSADENILENSNFFIICVPTPVSKNYVPNYKPVEEASRSISKYLRKNDIVILESTVNPGTCEEIVSPILEKGTGLKVEKDFTLAHCPERINPGDSKWNVYNITRNIGSLPVKNVKKVADFYRSFIEADINEYI